MASPIWSNVHASGPVTMQVRVFHVPSAFGRKQTSALSVIQNYLGNQLLYISEIFLLFTVCNEFLCYLKAVDIERLKQNLPKLLNRIVKLLWFSMHLPAIVLVIGHLRA